MRPGVILAALAIALVVRFAFGLGSEVVDYDTLADRGCLGGQYVEELPRPFVAIDDLTAAYQPARVEDLVLGVLERRYAVGHFILTSVPTTRCIETYLVHGQETAPDVLRSLSVLVHECGHMLDRMRSQGSNAYVFTPQLTLSCPRGDTTSRGGRTFARSRIRDDAFAASWPPCGEDGEDGCDMYADLYLDGDPDDDTHQSGDQGFNLLLEEQVQYVNSLATAYAFHGEVDRGSHASHRDGVLTMLWYVERYLHRARTLHPEAYQHLVHGEDGCWRRAILTAWGRSVLYLDATRKLPQLGLHHGRLLKLVRTPELLEEIERLRVAEGCRGPDPAKPH